MAVGYQLPGRPLMICHVKVDAYSSREHGSRLQEMWTEH